MTQSTKLTLRLDSSLIKSAKAFAQDNERSLSQLVADYFARLGDRSAMSQSGNVINPKQKRKSGVGSINQADEAPLSPVTLSLRGALAAKPAPKVNAKQERNDDPDKAAYRKHLETKHL